MTRPRLSRAAFAALIDQATAENTDLRIRLLEQRALERLARATRALAWLKARRRTPRSAARRP
ncbi:MAG TPA: hypothetical protein PLO65_02290 [Caulobacter sp.]|nr:hypothetical protein [Caulobacter sp.]